MRMGMYHGYKGTRTSTHFKWQSSTHVLFGVARRHVHHMVASSRKDVGQLLVPPALVEPRAVQLVLTRVCVEPPPARAAASSVCTACCSRRCKAVGLSLGVVAVVIVPFRLSIVNPHLKKDIRLIRQEKFEYFPQQYYGYSTQLGFY